MNDSDEPADLSASQKLAALVAARKAARQPHAGAPGRRSTERSAAAASASKSKPAPRKG